jgi:hypothetical protein
MTGKRYGSTEHYEDKLERIMERFGASDFNYSVNRRECWVEFWIESEYFHLTHSVEKAQSNGQKINYGSDAFAQLVLGLEDLARISERGIYKITKWLAGMKFLKPPAMLPEFFEEMSFDHLPATLSEVKKQYYGLSQVRHPDKGGSEAAMDRLNKAYKQAQQYFEGR